MHLYKFRRSRWNLLDPHVDVSTCKNWLLETHNEKYKLKQEKKEKTYCLLLPAITPTKLSKVR